MAIYKLGVMHPRLVFEGVGILTTFWFLWHNFGSRYARKQIKGSKNWDDGLVSKLNLSQKICSLNWHQKPGNHKTTRFLHVESIGLTVEKGYPAKKTKQLCGLIIGIHPNRFHNHRLALWNL